MSIWQFIDADGNPTQMTFSGQEKHLLQNIPSGMTAQLVETLPIPIAIDASVSARNIRDSILSSTDWTQLADAPLSEEQLISWRAYRQALRNIPEQEGFPNEITWPEPP